MYVSVACIINIGLCAVSYIVGLHSKPFVHFVIQAPNWYNCTLICCEHFQILGQLNFSLYVRQMGFHNGRHLKSSFAIIYGHNDTRLDSGI